MERVKGYYPSGPYYSPRLLGLPGPGPASNSLGISSYKFWNKFKFESSLNFKGVQTFLQKSDKFLKITSSHDIHEYNFRLTHLYSNIGSSFISWNRYIIYFIP
jgi:hypothetical protein